MNKFYATLLVLTMAVPATGLCDSNQKQDGQNRPVRPNVLILMAEDMSSRVGAFGDPVAVTPGLDKLAASGVRFPNTFTSAGVCAPSRAAHITGMHQISIGGQHMRTRSFTPTPYRAVPPPDVKAYPELLRQQGYYTLTNHKLDYQFSNYGAGSGPFTIWDYEGDEPDWSQREEGQPFFALINFAITHESQLFDKKVKKNQEKGQVSVVPPGLVSVPPYYPDTATVRRDIARQYDNIAVMDTQVSEWLAKLKADGLADNTIVIWTTDHGDGLPRAKREIYDSGIKVPMIIYWPEHLRPEGAEVGSIDERLISFVDFAPSVLTWAGITTPDFMQGRPTLSNLDEERQYIYASKDRLDEFPFRERAVRDQRYKYLYNYQAGEPGAKHIAYRDQLGIMTELWSYYENDLMSAQQAFWFEPRPEEEFYDLAFDPHEVNNLVEDPQYQAELNRMRTAFTAWQARVADYSEEPEAEMSATFWPDGEQPITSEPEISIEKGKVVLQCETVGASIGYRLDGGRWQVYSQPFNLPSGSKLSVKAVRYGWQESKEITL
jgi:N-sulfoglucosamine sulfohydrolase